MGKSRNYDKELDQIDRLKQENARLKRDYAKLRKQIDRLNLDHDRYRTLRELVHKQVQEERKPLKHKKERVCYECGKGTMHFHEFERRDGVFYFRKCSIKECGHQTRMKRLTEDVEKS